LRGPPLFSSSAGCLKRSVRTQTAGRLFFWLLYFWRSKRKVTSCRATPGSGTQTTAKLQSTTHYKFDSYPRPCSLGYRQIQYLNAACIERRGPCPPYRDFGKRCGSGVSDFVRSAIRQIQKTAANRAPDQGADTTTPRRCSAKKLHIISVASGPSRALKASRSSPPLQAWPSASIWQRSS
jgi:hypothetical protein